MTAGPQGDPGAHEPHGSHDVDGLLAEAYALDGPAANRELYARWASTYDSEFVVDAGYVYPDRVIEVFVSFASGELAAGDWVVDVGCGTGLAGAALRSVQLTGCAGRELVLDGLDISPEMLARAAARSQSGLAVYRDLIEADLTATVPVADHTYAAAISVGTFTHGHVGPASLDEVVRIVRPGGVAVIGINAAHFAAQGFSARFDALVAADRITNLRFTDVAIYRDTAVGDPDRTSTVAQFRIG